ncbi:DUF4097 family beta strand repeat-containing protein [Aerococcaceae bacterium WGS1372]
MNEKERIIELVKQNIISMDEALDLLEAASSSVKESNEINQKNKDINNQPSELEQPSDSKNFNKSMEEVIKDGKNIARNVSDYFANRVDQSTQNDSQPVDKEDNTEFVEKEKRRKAKLVQIEAELRDLHEEFERRHEALTICNQRLREIEIFEELEDLTEEISTQKMSLEDKKLQIEDKLKLVQEKMDTLNGEKERLGGNNQYTKTDFKEIFSTNTDKISEVASQFGREAKREGKKWGSVFNEKSKSFMENFKLKNFDVSIQVPWIKTTTEEFDWTFNADEVTELVFESYNGSIELESYDGDEILVHSETHFYGNHVETTEELFLSSNMIDVFENQFIVKLTSTKMSADLSIKIPKKVYQLMQFNLLNGDVELADIEAENLLLESKNGDTYFKRVTVNEITVDVLNGDIEFIQSPLETIVLNIINGDVRINGYINNLSAETLNSDFYLTKNNVSESNIKVKTMHGDIKLSLPEHLNLMIDGKATTGEIKNRLSNVETMDENESKSKVNYHRIVPNQTANAKVSMTTQSGDIYLKDSKNKV